MGSTGSGSFTDYSKRKPQNIEDTSGGSSGIDKCKIAFSTNLEETARCFYFINNSTVPPHGTEILVVFNGLRLAVETRLGEEIGYLPTRFNYIKICIDNGFNYQGVITTSRNVPSPSITVDIIPV